jgi:hypothetical protein
MLWWRWRLPGIIRRFPILQLSGLVLGYNFLRMAFDARDTLPKKVYIRVTLNLLPTASLRVRHHLPPDSVRAPHKIRHRDIQHGNPKATFFSIGTGTQFH